MSSRVLFGWFGDPVRTCELRKELCWIGAMASKPESGVRIHEDALRVSIEVEAVARTPIDIDPVNPEWLEITAAGLQ